MYCMKCGRQIPDSSDFCQFCGTNQQSGRKEDILTITNVPTGNSATVYKIISVICSFLIVFLSFFELIKLDMGWFGDTGYSIIEACILIWGYIDIGLINSGWSLIIILLLGFGLLLIVGPLVYAIRDLKSRDNEERFIILNYGQSIMDIIIITFVLLIAGVFIMSLVLYAVDSVISGIGFTWTAYFILAITIVNRFVFLSKYRDLCYQNKAKEKESVLEKEKMVHVEDRKEILTPEEDVYKFGPKKIRVETSSYYEERKNSLPNQWQCKKCGKTHYNYVGSCGCGNTQRENMYL